MQGFPLELRQKKMMHTMTVLFLLIFDRKVDYLPFRREMGLKVFFKFLQNACFF